MPPAVVNDPEFALAVACCRWNFAGGDGADIGAMSASIDWPRLVRMADRHRVQALVWNCLARLEIAMPVASREALSARSATIVEQNLRAAIECARLRDAFARSGIDMIFVKGLTLGALAYRSSYLKMGRDIDLLVDPDAASDAAAVLADAGYASWIPAPPASASRISAWHRLHKESVWYKDDGQVQLDLHTRLASHRTLIQAIGLGSPRQSVSVADGIDLATLADDALVAYLCVHGASSAWFRIKWVSDLAALLHRRTAEEIERLYDASQALGAGPAASQAFLLCHRLFAIDMGEGLTRRLGAAWANRTLERIAMRELAGRADLREPTDVRLGTAMIHLSQLLLVEKLRDKVGEARRQAREMLSARSWQASGAGN